MQGEVKINLKETIPFFPFIPFIFPIGIAILIFGGIASRNEEIKKELEGLRDEVSKIGDILKKLTDVLRDMNN